MGQLKSRVDQLVVDRALAESREQAKRLILAGQIRANGQLVDKPGKLLPADAQLERVGTVMPYVSRGGLKLAAALDRFAVEPPTDFLAIDIGASTGGFTDCLLQRGAAKVVAIDTGRGQIHERLRTDPRVELHENTNARYVTPDDLGHRQADLIVIDVSFISLRHILPAAAALLKESGQLIALIKPQFEAGRGEVGSGGIVRDPKIHESVLRAVTDFCIQTGWRVQGLMASPILGGEGNAEFLVCLDRRPENGVEFEEALQSALEESARLRSGG